MRNKQSTIISFLSGALLIYAAPSIAASADGIDQILGIQPHQKIVGINSSAPSITKSTAPIQKPVPSPQVKATPVINHLGVQNHVQTTRVLPSAHQDQVVRPKSLFVPATTTVPDQVISPAITATPYHTLTNAGRLAQAQSQAALLQVKLEIATLEAKIKKVRSGENSNSPSPVNPYANVGGAPGIGFTPGTGFPSGARIPNSMSFQSPTRQKVTIQAPRVLSLMGAGSRYTATLALPDGAIMAVYPGMNIGDGWKVTQVDSNGVLAAHNGKVEPLAFSPQSGEQRGSSGETGMSGAPSMSSLTPPNIGTPGSPVDGMGASMPPPIPGGIAPGTGIAPNMGLPGQGG
ncbi:MAG: type IV pilus biogenesis protein PilP [Acidithiobacillus sp.]|nr:type IV pilus biogenesis protein PilP [Acidithiobacillus sp.]